MIEYIDREAAISEVVSIHNDRLGAYHAIKDLPAADVKPVVRGRWEETGGFSDEMIDWVRCSRCGEEAPGFTDNYNFCPHCGADMREGEEE